MKYGLYDLDLAVWTDSEAFVLRNGAWREHEPFRMWDGACINVPEAYLHRLLAAAPPLPDGAFAQKLA